MFQPNANELAHCMKHAHTHRRNVECWGCTIERLTKEGMLPLVRKTPPNWVTHPQIMRELQEKE